MGNLYAVGGGTALYKQTYVASTLYIRTGFKASNIALFRLKML